MSSSRIKQTVVQGHTFSIDERYKPKTILGRGSFGVVCTAYDEVTENTLAIKRIRPYANDDWDARHTLREIRLMKLFRSHPNIISLYRLSTYDEKSELYMVMELMDCDLHRIIQSKQPLSDAHIKCFAKQLLEGIHALHSAGVFHRDIKPGNILVSKDCQLRITDFGLARFMHEETLNGDNDRNPMTEYVVTRWYRCPELLLAPSRPYSAAVDMWSIGCILGELIRRKPLFPGKGHTHQVQLIFEVRGYSSPPDLGFPVSEETRQWLSKKCSFPGQSLSSFIPKSSKESIALIDSFLQIDPASRPSAAEALQSKYLSDAQVINDYSTVDIKKPSKQIFDFEKEKFTLAELKAMIREEIRSYDDSNGGYDVNDIDEILEKDSGQEQKKIYSLEGRLVETSNDQASRPKSAPDSISGSGVETFSRSRNVTSSTDEYMSRNIRKGSNNSNDNRFGNHQYIRPTSTDSAAANSTSGIDDSTTVTSGVTALNHDKPGAAYANLSNANAMVPVAPSPKKIDSMLAKDAKIKRRFFLQNLLSSKQSGSVKDKSNIESNKGSHFGLISGKAMRSGMHTELPSIKPTIVGDSFSNKKNQSGFMRPSLMNAFRGSFMSREKKPFYGSVPK